MILVSTALKWEIGGELLGLQRQNGMILMTKKAYASLLFLTLVALGSCEKVDVFVGNYEYIVAEYDNPRGTPELTILETSSHLSFDPASVTAVDNGQGDVNVIVDGIRISNAWNNFAVSAFSVEECDGDNCALGGWEGQFEFDQDSSFQETDVMAVLVLDVSTSLGNNIADLKSYAKDFARTVVESTPNSYVSVVVFSEEIRVFPFENEQGLQDIYNAIDGYTNYQARTTLYGACEVGLEVLNQVQFDGAKNLVVFTDGGDNNTDNPESVLTSIQASSINRFAIGLQGEDFNKSDLRALASGRSNFVVAQDFADLETAFRTISRQVANVYRIQYNRSDQLLDNPIKIRFKLEVEKEE